MIEPVAHTQKGRRMQQIDASSHVMSERLLVWREEAQRAGRDRRAEALLLLAWRAYDRPPARCEQGG
jgi:hypothetical protein